MRLVAIAVAALALTGCQTAQEQQDPPVWGRFDCRRAATDPEVVTLFEQARAVCMNRAQAAAVAGTTAIPTGHGIGGAIASGIERGMAQNEIGTSTAISCMAEYGWLRARQHEHAARCPAASRTLTQVPPMTPRPR